MQRLDLEPSPGTLKDDLIWGVAAIAAAIGREPRQTYHLLATGQLPGRKVGARWVCAKSKLRAYLLGGVEAA